jgi:hypothetical protein
LTAYAKKLQNRTKIDAELKKNCDYFCTRCGLENGVKNVFSSFLFPEVAKCNQIFLVYAVFYNARKKSPGPYCLSFTEVNANSTQINLVYIFPQFLCVLATILCVIASIYTIFMRFFHHFFYNFFLQFMCVYIYISVGLRAVGLRDNAIPVFYNPVERKQTLSPAVELQKNWLSCNVIFSCFL